MSFWVYILTNKTHSTLYVGVTNNIQRRLFEHRSNRISSFTSKYRTYKLVFAEETTDASSAISREKQIKRWRREKKIALIERLNPGWEDLGGL
ncbi:MAG: GIY-YIG nuclease family protein [Pseudomonadota bacterium]